MAGEAGELGGKRYIPIKKLIALLQSLPDDSNIGISRVYEIMILNKDIQYIGFINIFFEEMELLEASEIGAYNDTRS